METEIIERLYRSEINFEMCSYFDDGYQLKLGDSKNGFKMMWYGDNYKEVIKMLAKIASREYPRSEFAKWWGEKNGN